MFPRFALCLAPLLVVGVLLVIVGLEVVPADNVEWVAYLCIVLVGIGALLSAFFVARLVFRGIQEPGWWKILASILVYLIVVVGYFTIGFFGGCFLLVLTAQ